MINLVTFKDSRASIYRYALLATVFLGISGGLSAQTFYVDAAAENDQGNGSQDAPFSTIEQAVIFCNSLSGEEPVTIKVLPGLYQLKDVVVVKNTNIGNTAKYSIEAAILPDDPSWMPYSMPVIQSVSLNNNERQFPHAVGFLIGSNNVRFQGLKFVGNTNPMTSFYYPISREDGQLIGLEISQCYFIGERYSSPIQSAVWAYGASIEVDHCIFYNCRNALLLFAEIKNLSVTHSLFYGMYEAAIWFGPFEADFTFKYNVVSNCHYFWLRPEHTAPAYTFSNSLIADNDHFMGMYTQEGLVESKQDNHHERNVDKSGRVRLVEGPHNVIPKNYLHLSPKSAGKELEVGVFKEIHEFPEETYGY